MASNGTNGVHADPASWKHYNEGSFLFTVGHSPAYSRANRSSCGVQRRISRRLRPHDPIDPFALGLGLLLVSVTDNLSVRVRR